ncbi:MAG: carboxyl transferase domain-containing protein, partial [Bacteroidota bacterium]
MSKKQTAPQQTEGIHPAHQLRLDELQTRRENACAGGGEKSTERHKSKGKMTVRERIDFLLDDPESWLELGLHAADGMYEEYGGANSAGVVTGLGTVSGRRVMIVAN